MTNKDLTILELIKTAEKKGFDMSIGRLKYVHFIEATNGEERFETKGESLDEAVGKMLKLLKKV